MYIISSSLSIFFFFQNYYQDKRANVQSTGTVAEIRLFDTIQTYILIKKLVGDRCYDHFHVFRLDSATTVHQNSIHILLCAHET